MYDCGDKLRRLRKAKGLSQRELAEMASLHESAVRSYELKARNPKEPGRLALAKVLGVSPDALRDYGIRNEDECAHALMEMEDAFGLVPDVLSDQPVIIADSEASAMADFIKQWSDMKKKLDGGQMTSQEYEEWKDTYPRRKV